jgi:hypothetical protein
MDEQLNRLEKKIDALYASAEKTRKYFLWTLIITAGAILIPLLILPLVIPLFLQSVALPPGL